MYEHDGNVIRSRYDYYYSVSSPAISQATNFFENQHASLFGDPVLPLLPQAIPIPNQLPPPASFHQSPDRNNNSNSCANNNNNNDNSFKDKNNNVHKATSASTDTTSTTNATLDNSYVGFSGPPVATPLIDNFDQHLYESIRRNFLDSQKNQAQVDKSQLWQDQHNSTDSSSPPPEDFEVKRKRTCSAMGSYEHFDDAQYNLSPSKYRALSARSCSLRNCSTETSDYEPSRINRKSLGYSNKSNTNSNSTINFINRNILKVKCKSNLSSMSRAAKSLPKIVKPKSAKETPIRSRVATPSSKFVHSVTHACSRPISRQPSHISLSASNNKLFDNNNLKTYPNSFTIISSPVVSAPPTPRISRRKFLGHESDDFDEFEMDWIKPPPDKLLEAGQVLDEMITHPTSPILTDKILIASDYRPNNAGATPTAKSHRKQAFAIINDFKGRRHKIMEHHMSDDNLNQTGRYSPYTRYQLQREYLHLRSLSPESAPPLHTRDLLENDFDPYVYDEFNQGDEGRKTSIGFIHKRALSTSAINMKKRPRSEFPDRRQKEEIQYQSTPNFIKINRKMVATQTQQIQQKRHSAFPVLKRKQKAILQVYNNTNVIRRTFSMNDMAMEGEACIEPPKAPLPINADGKRSRSLLEQQKESKRKRKEMRQRGLSPIAGTPSKDKAKRRMTDRERREMFGLVPKRVPKKPKEIEPQQVSDHSLAAIQFAREPNTKKLSALRNITSLLGGRKRETGPPPPTTPAKPKGLGFMGLNQQLQARSVLSKNLKAKMSAKRELSKQNSKQSLMSMESLEPPPAAPEKVLKKRGSFGSLKSLSSSIKTSISLRSNKSASIDEEAAEAADEVTNLASIIDPKSSKKKLQTGFIRVKMTNRLTPKSRGSSAKSQKSVKEPAPAPSRTASKTSLRSVAASQKTIDSTIMEEKPPSRSSSKSDKLVPLSKFSIASMTTAAITSQPLAVTTTITNELARQGAEKKEAAAASAAPSASEREVASSKGADAQSVASIKTMSSIRTLTSRKGGGDSKPSSRKASAKKERGSSARPGSRIFISAANTAMAVRAMMKSTRSNDSIDSIHSDATQITLGQGSGADNQDAPSTHISDPADRSSMRSASRGGLSRQSTRLDMKTPARKAATGASTTTLKKSLSKTSLIAVQPQAAAASAPTADSTSINAINMMPESEMQLQGEVEDVMEEDEEAYEDEEESQADEEDIKMSSSMDDVSRKRKWCWGLSSCCDRTSSEMDLNEEEAKPKTCCQKFGSCLCVPFRCCFKRRKRESKQSDESMDDKPSFWERICCCSSCCRKKKDAKMDTKKKLKASAKDTDKQGCCRSCWGRLNCFRCCKPCCSRMSNACCSCCKKKTPSAVALQKEKEKDMPKPGLCKRIFCPCMVKYHSCESKAKAQRRADSIASDPKKKRNICYRMWSKIFCCCMKKDDDSRRTSMLSKKQSLAPTIPPPEDNKPKLDMTLVEHASIMKGAIPVLPIFLAWFCLVFNTFIPGTGTIFSGFFCLCLGIPRFSQHDRVRGRIGAFVINCIVGVSQAFTIIFCLVGWGWSIWWGTTMLNLARRHKKLKDAEMNNNEQADNGTISTKSSQPPRKDKKSSANRDVEAGRK